MPNKRYKLSWVLKYFFPGLFIIIFFNDLIGDIYSSRNYSLMDFIMLLIGFYILYTVLYFLTLEYELNDNRLIVHNFIFRKKVYLIEDILQIKEEGNYWLFRKIPFGINRIIINIRNGKDLVIIGLKDHFTLLEKLRSIMSN